MYSALDQWFGVAMLALYFGLAIWGMLSVKVRR